MALRKALCSCLTSYFFLLPYFSSLLIALHHARKSKFQQTLQQSVIPFSLSLLASLLYFYAVAALSNTTQE